MKVIVYVLVICGVLFGMVAQAAMTSNNGYTIWSDVISSGGTESASSTNYSVSDTISEQAFYASSTSDYTGGFGFRYTLNNALSLSLSASSLDFGELATDATQTVSHTLTVQTNSNTGVSVVVTGNTLEDGANSVTAIGSTAAAATPGTSQFGLNVVNPVGDAPAANATASYNTTGLYAYASGDQIITAADAINSTTFTINYIANISGSEPAGSYGTTLTYTATANF